SWQTAGVPTDRGPNIRYRISTPGARIGEPQRALVSWATVVGAGARMEAGPARPGVVDELHPVLWWKIVRGADERLGTHGAGREWPSAGALGEVGARAECV